MAMEIDRKLPRLEDINKLPKLHRLIMNYFMKYISVGELVAIIELREQVKSLKDPELVPELDDIIIEREISKAIAYLVEHRYLEHGEGCYNLAEHLREELKKEKKYSMGGQRRLF